MKPTICVGGPLAGSRCKLCPPDYIAWAWDNFGAFVYVPEFPKDSPEEFLERLSYGYEQHCKAVAERNKPSVFAQQAAETLQKGLVDFSKYAPEQCTDSSVLSKELQDSYTASFLRSCKTVIIVNPFGEPSPLTLSYGKCQYGHLNDSMEFVVPMTVIENKLESISESNLGRIGTPIAIIP